VTLPTSTLAHVMPLLLSDSIFIITMNFIIRKDEMIINKIKRAETQLSLKD